MNFTKCVVTLAVITLSVLYGVPVSMAQQNKNMKMLTFASQTANCFNCTTMEKYGVTQVNPVRVTDARVGR